MTSRSSRGHREVPHTADWAMQVWAEDLPSLFAEAVQGMNSLSGMQLKPAPRIARLVQMDERDEESLLVAFLSEVLYLLEHENLGFDDSRIEISGGHLRAKLKGAPLLSVEKPIKAVTFHNLHIERTEQGYMVELVFDV